MPEPTDPTGAWIDHLHMVSGKERAERLSAMTQHEKDAVLLLLLAQRTRLDTAALERLAEARRIESSHITLRQVAQVVERQIQSLNDLPDRLYTADVIEKFRDVQSALRGKTARCPQCGWEGSHDAIGCTRGGRYFCPRCGGTGPRVFARLLGVKW